MKRREFLLQASAFAAVSAVPSLRAASQARVRGANEDIRVAVIGFNGRGKDHIQGFRGVKGVRLVALCDVDRHVLDGGKQELDKAGIDVATYTDARKMLDSSEIDAVSIATPNHWHSLMAIWAIQAGKDVYVEKPVSHNVWEGRQLVLAARKHSAIVQTGTQSRSNPGLRDAIAWVHEGNIGAIKLVRGLCYKPRMSIGKVDRATPIPDSVDYDLWCGPAPKTPLMRQKLHYDWHWQFSTGNGDLGNQGIHQMDIARWVLGENTLSPKVLSVGGRFGYEDDGNTPNTQFVYHGYKKAPLIFEVRGLPRSKELMAAKWGEKEMPDYKGAKIGVVVNCENGYVVIPSYESATAYDPKGNVIKTWKEGADHYANFISAVRSRKNSDLNAEIEQGHLSSGLCHTGNISYLLGTELSPAAIQDRLKGEPEAAETYGRLAEHLEADGIDLAKTPARFGELLAMNPTTERFVGNAKADLLLTREYRKGFEVPSYSLPTATSRA
ncbi:MAG TPA: Gfo/Idh/MocA family oxidoreductase [Candidatus Limnocylindria bacterium]|nr:Gfo/Idh/MocA family oxidoreductase [Candidatus Limnocylindria bacterium]